MYEYVLIVHISQLFLISAQRTLNPFEDKLHPYSHDYETENAGEKGGPGFFEELGDVGGLGEDDIGEETVDHNAYYQNPFGEGHDGCVGEDQDRGNGPRAAQKGHGERYYGDIFLGDPLFFLPGGAFQFGSPGPEEIIGQLNQDEPAGNLKSPYRDPEKT